MPRFEPLRSPGASPGADHVRRARQASSCRPHFILLARHLYLPPRLARSILMTCRPRRVPRIPVPDRSSHRPAVSRPLFASARRRPRADHLLPLAHPTHPQATSARGTFARHATQALTRRGYAFRLRLARMVSGMSTGHQAHAPSREKTTPLMSAPGMALL